MSLTRSVGWIVAGAAIAVLAGCSREADARNESKKEAAAAPLEVQVARAEVRSLERTVSLTGSLMPDETVKLSAEVPGTVARYTVDFGQPVRKGQVLVELDTRELSLQLDRSRAALSQALARIGLSPNDTSDNIETTPAIRQARAQMEDARFKLQSAEKLVKTGDISRDRYNELEKTFRAREAALEAARDELRTQMAAILGLRAELKLAQKRLDDATVEAPFDGAVTERLASPGQFMKENTPLLTLVKTHPLRLRVDVPENAVAGVRVNTTLNFTTDAVPGETFQAVVRELNPSLDSQSRSLTAEARMTKADSRLRPGMFVQVQLLSGKRDVVVVPKEAVYQVAGLTKVFAIRDGVAVECKVPPGEVLGDWVALPTIQLKPGETVATSNLASLVDGAKVQVKA